LLRRKGYNVIEAEDGVEGLLKASGHYPDLILMDLALPKMDGVLVKLFQSNFTTGDTEMPALSLTSDF
jgi:CheY-like chemotaxis protein